MRRDIENLAITFISPRMFAASRVSRMNFIRSSYRRRLAILMTCVALLTAPLFGEKKLKGFYGGSGGITPDVYRVVMVEFGEDGSAIVQQNWTGKDQQVWHTRWTQNGKQVKIVFDSVKDAETPK